MGEPFPCRVFGREYWGCKPLLLQVCWAFEREDQGNQGRTPLPLGNVWALGREREDEVSDQLLLWFM